MTSFANVPLVFNSIQFNSMNINHCFIRKVETVCFEFAIIFFSKETKNLSHVYSSSTNLKKVHSISIG